jgi:hypothetical protein
MNEKKPAHNTRRILHTQTKKKPAHKNEKEARAHEREESLRTRTSYLTDWPAAEVVVVVVRLELMLMRGQGLPRRRYTCCGQKRWYSGASNNHHPLHSMT